MHILASSHDVIPAFWLISVGTAAVSLIYAFAFFRLHVGRTVALASVILSAVVFVSYAGPVLLGNTEPEVSVLLVHLLPALLAYFAYGVCIRPLWQSLAPRSRA